MVAQISGFEVMRLVQELKALEGAFLQKAYQPWEGLFVLRFNARSSKQALVHKVGEWLYLADEKDEELGPVWDAEGGKGAAGEDVAPFVRVLRDHVANAFVIGARQLAFDRIIEIELRKEEPFFLVIEMFGDGNVILHKDGIIIGALRSQTWRHRVIRGGKEYRPPPTRKDPRSIGLAELATLLKGSSADLVRTLATSVNLGGTYAEEVCQRAGLDKALRAKDLELDAMKAIQAAISELTSEVQAGTGGYIHSQDGKRAVVSAVRLRKFGDSPVEELQGLSSAIKACHPLEGEREAQSRAEGTSVAAELEADIARLERQREQQGSAIERFRKEIAEATTSSEALYVNYKDVEAVLEQVRKVRDEKGWRDAIKAFPELELDQSQSTMRLELKGQDGSPIKVTLDLRKGVNENAQVIYESMKTVKDKLKGAEYAVGDTNAEIAKLVSERDRALADAEMERTEVRSKVRARRKRFWFETNRWFISRDGNVVIGGKDASSNQRIVKRHLAEGDRYIHADIHGAPSVIVKAQDQDGKPKGISEATLEEACHFAVCFSKAWSSAIGSGEAYWVTPEQVSTKPQSGEFLPKGGFIIRGKRNYVRNLDLRLAVGIIDLAGTKLAMCGPIESIKARTENYHVLVPSKGKKSDVTKSLAKALGVPIEDIETILPPGGMDVVPKDR